VPRAERLLDLIQILRRHRRPVSGHALADELGVSLRTLYRDIAALQAQGARIDGEPGVGYVLRPGFLMPPLMFSEEEIEALVLGARWVAERADAQLGAAARNAPSGRSRWAFSSACASSSRGASCAGRSAISAPTASRR
jgi:predicted DNA-binding transcriptional regulator YafY